MKQDLIFNYSQEHMSQTPNQIISYAGHDSHKILSLAQQKFQKNKSVFNIAVLSKQSLTKLNWFFSQNKFLDQNITTQQSIATESFQNTQNFDLNSEESKQNVLLNLLKLKVVKSDPTNSHFTRKVAAVNVGGQDQKNYMDNATTTSYEKLYEEDNDFTNNHSQRGSKHNQSRRAKTNCNDMLAQQVMNVKKTIQKLKTGSKVHRSAGNTSSQMLSEKSSTSAESKMNDFSDNFTDQGGKKCSNNPQKLRFSNIGKQSKGSKGSNIHRISMRQKKKSQLLKMNDQLYI